MVRSFPRVVGLEREGKTQKVQRICHFETRTYVKSERESIGVSVSESLFMSWACFG